VTIDFATANLDRALLYGQKTEMGIKFFGHQELSGLVGPVVQKSREPCPE
jgi:hypothetical protein